MPATSVVPLSPDHYIVLRDPASSRRHLWVFEGDSSVDPQRASQAIDDALAAINPSYAALRLGSALIDAPRVLVLPRGTFDAYVAEGFARRGQFKFRHLHADIHALSRVRGLSAISQQLQQERAS